jgi:hypothetical protein
MGTIYVLGAGFSKTCGIATDVGMLDALNPTLKRSTTPGVAGRRTTIEYLRDQVFANQPRVGLELFMSTLSSLKFMSDYVSNDHNKRTNIFRDEEREMRGLARGRTADLGLRGKCRLGTRLCYHVQLRFALGDSGQATWPIHRSTD